MKARFFMRDGKVMCAIKNGDLVVDKKATPEIIKRFRHYYGAGGLAQEAVDQSTEVAGGFIGPAGKIIKNKKALLKAWQDHLK